MAKGTNPRLPYYKSKLEEEGIKAEYHFLGEENSGWIKNFVQSFIYSFKIALGNRVDCFYIYGPNALFLPIYIAAKLRGTRIIVEKTELDSIRPDKKLKDHMVKLAYKFDERIAPKYAKGMVVITEKLREHYKFSARAIHVCPAFVDPKRFEIDGIVKDENRISYLGTFGSKDDVSGIVKAFLKAKETLPEIRLHLYGKSPDNQTFNHEGVLMIGSLKFDEIPRVLMESSLLISNRTESEYSKYGSPTKLVEYMASGVPVIATTGKNQLSFLENNENYFQIKSGDFLSLASLIIDRFANREKFDAVGQIGRQSVIDNASSKNIVTDWFNFVMRKC